MAVRHWLIVCAIGLLLFLWGVSVMAPITIAAEPGAATSQAPTPGYLQYQEPPKTGTSTMGTIAYVITLLLMFLAIIGFAYFTSRFVASRASRLGQTGDSRIHMTLPMAPNRNLHLVEMAGRYFVVGVTEQSIQLLFQFENPEEVLPYLTQRQNQATSFEDVFARQLNALKDLRSSFPQVFPVSDKKDDHSEKR
jgi:flagellar protein FliO/FliZ